MALINCKECGKEISENAKACPNCGNPNPLMEQKKEQEKEQQLKEQKQAQVIMCVIAFIFIIGIYFFISNLWDGLDGDGLLNAIGVDTSNNTITIKEKSKKQVKNDVMDWFGFEYVEE